MKKFSLVILVFALVFTSLFANGSPEEQQLFFENLIRNSQQPSSYPTSAVGSTTLSGSNRISRDMSQLERLYQYVEKNFLYDIDYDAVYEAMATAMFDALGDKYTYYVTAEESEDYAEEVSGTYGGLGIYFSKTYVQNQDTNDENTLYAIITQVFPNTPASKVGLKANDFIIEINGESVIEKEATECARLMKGVVGTSVELTIKRGESIFKINVTREMITVPTVEFEMMGDSGTAYLRILEFSSSTYSAIYSALEELQSQGMKKLIIDLRDNPGGDVDATLAIADLFITDSRLLSITYKDPSKNITYTATDGVLVSPDVEVAILVNGGTASSAEIFSSAMRDSGRALIFGSTTYGKGIMQIVSSFGSGYTSITTASFVGPSGKTIHGEGVEPDFSIEDVVVSDEELEAYTSLVNGNDIKNFVKENPDYTVDNIQKFADQYEGTGLRERILQLVVRNQYLSEMDYDDRPLSDIVYDDVCRSAYEYLQTWELDTKVVNF